MLRSMWEDIWRMDGLINISLVFLNVKGPFI